MFSDRVMRRYEGIPPNYQARWRYISLDSKLPMPTRIPKGAVTQYYGTGDIGEKPARERKYFDFNLWDPKLFQTSRPTLEYNSLIDSKLRSYFANNDLLQILYRKNLITRDGKVLCSLRELNHWRAYVHRVNVEIVRTRQLCSEESDIQELIFMTLNEVQNRRRAMLIEGYKDAHLATIDYSCIAKEQADKLMEQWIQQFENSQLFQNAPEGEKEVLKKLFIMLKRDIYKNTLIRLRRLQAYEDLQNKAWRNWKIRGRAAVQEKAASIIKDKILENERIIHIREHIQITSCQQAEVIKKITESSEQHEAMLNQRAKMIQKKICISSNREYPLSARCPPYVMEGGEYGDPCRWEQLAQQLEADLYVDSTTYTKSINNYLSKRIVKPAICNFKEFQAREQFDIPQESETIEIDEVSTLVNNVIRNGLDLLIKHLRLPLTVQVKMDHTTAVKLKIFVYELKKEIKDQLDLIVENNGEALKIITEAIRKSSPCAQKKDVLNQKWGDAPLLKSNSQTLMGRYVRDQLLKVMQKLRCRSEIEEDETDVANSVLRQRIQQAIDELTSSRTTEQLKCRLYNGEEIVAQTENYLKYLNIQDDLDSDVVSLITFLIRTSILKFKDHIACRLLTASDLLALAKCVNMDLILRSVMQRMTLEKLIDKYALELIESKHVTALIENTVKKISPKPNCNLAEDNNKVKFEMLKSAKIFLTKILDNILEDNKKMKKRFVEIYKPIDEEDKPPCDYISFDENQSPIRYLVEEENVPSVPLLCENQGPIRHHAEEKNVPSVPPCENFNNNSEKNFPGVARNNNNREIGAADNSFSSDVGVKLNLKTTNDRRPDFKSEMKQMFGREFLDDASKRIDGSIDSNRSDESDIDSDSSGEYSVSASDPNNVRDRPRSNDNYNNFVNTTDGSSDIDDLQRLRTAVVSPIVDNDRTFVSEDGGEVVVGYRDAIDQPLTKFQSGDDADFDEVGTRSPESGRRNTTLERKGLTDSDKALSAGSSVGQSRRFDLTSSSSIDISASTSFDEFTVSVRGADDDAVGDGELEGEGNAKGNVGEKNYEDDFEFKDDEFSVDSVASLSEILETAEYDEMVEDFVKFAQLPSNSDKSPKAVKDDTKKKNKLKTHKVNTKKKKVPTATLR